MKISFKKLTQAAIIVGLSSMAFLSNAQDAVTDTDFEKKIEFQLPKLFASLYRGAENPDVLSFFNNNDTGMYSVFLTNGDHFIFDNEGSTVIISIRGEMNVIDLNKNINITEGERLKQVQVVAETFKPMYVVKAKGEEIGKIMVAKDPQCGYCNKLEAEVPALIEAGITVEMYPLGVFPGSRKAMELSACSVDPKDAYDDVASKMRNLKTNLELKAQELDIVIDSRETEDAVFAAVVEDYFKANGNLIEDCNYPVNEISDRFNSAGLSGTPAILTSKGRLIRGYVEARVIINEFK